MSQLAQRNQGGMEKMVDDDQPQVLELSPQRLDVLSPATRGEIDQQITTAKRYPRSVKAFLNDATSLATIDEDTAAGCMYALPRDGKNIEGPSVRLAEIAYSCWGNIRAEAHIIGEDRHSVIAEGSCWDLEKNAAVRIQVTRSITNRSGQRFSQSMIETTKNACRSIAFREAIFKVIPRAFIKSVYVAARQVAVGDAKTLVAKRTDLVAYFGKMGVLPERVCLAVEKASVDDITLDDLATLRGIATAIKEGESTVDAAFPDPTKKVEEKPAAGAAALVGKLTDTGNATPAGAHVDTVVADAAAKVEEARARAKAQVPKSQEPTTSATPPAKRRWPVDPKKDKVSSVGYWRVQCRKLAGAFLVSSPREGVDAEMLVQRLEDGDLALLPSGLPGPDDGVAEAEVVNAYRQAKNALEQNPAAWGELS